jgi:phosphoenolpyruvate synthase/pyruvate phosphate dikinase
MQMDPLCVRPADTPIDGFDPRPVEVALNHPGVRALTRYATNQMGPQAKKKMMNHLKGCRECQIALTDYRIVDRRFRKLERDAIAAFGTAAKSTGRRSVRSE